MNYYLLTGAKGGKIMSCHAEDEKSARTFFKIYLKEKHGIESLRGFKVIER
ncbi:hypothetical protein [Bacillus swezeyi]|uniref:hypothetical protein n=1 Tax=Bacillus swezeyi TaxID=1925020 RepID=UPI00165365C3|nr:hypothetical protein [Bacillus swezeyi]